MSREDAAGKAARYLTEGRLLVEKVEPGLVGASCRGDGAVHQLGWDTGRGWHCSCPAKGSACCHLRALRLVVVRWAS